MKQSRLALGVVLAAALPLAAHADALLDRIAAVVNGKVITLSEVEERAAPALADGQGLDRQAILKQALQSIIDDRLIESALEERQISVTDAEIDNAIQEVLRQNAMTEPQFKQAIAAQGYTWAGYRAELGRQLSRYKLLNSEVRANVTVTDEDVKSWLARHGQGADAQEIRARHMLFRFPAGATPDQVAAAKAKAEKALARVKAGEDFGDVARAVSEDGTAPRGGDLGWFSRGTMVAPFEKAAFSAKDGEVVGPVRTQFGWHLIQVEAHRTKKGESDPAAVAEARRRLYDQELQRQTQRFVEALRKSASIDVRIEDLKS